MKLHKYLYILVIIAGLVLPALVFAEGQGEIDTPGTRKDAKNIVWFMRWDNERVEDVAHPIISAFETANPDINIVFENIGKANAYYVKLTTLAAAGDMPDVTYLAPHFVSIYASKKAIIPLDSFMAANKINSKEYYQNVLNFYKYNGALYGLPLDAAALCLFYNEDMFKAAGVAPFKKGYSWDDIRIQGAKFVRDLNGDGTPDQFAIHLRQDYWPVMLKANTDHGIFDNVFRPKKFLLPEKDSIRSFQQYLDFWLLHSVAPTPIQTSEVSDWLMAGKAAMFIIGAWNMPKYISSITSFKWNISPLPYGSTKKEYNRGDGSAFAVSVNSKNPEAAFRFVKFLAGPGGDGAKMLVDRQQMLPALRTLAESERFLFPKLELTGGLKLNKAAFFFGQDNQFSMYDPIHPIYEKINSVLQSELTEAFQGAVSGKDAIMKSVKQIELILKEVR